MLTRRTPHFVRLQWQLARRTSRVPRVSVTSTSIFPSILAPDPSRGAYCQPSRFFHASRRLQAVKPVLLADIGEGIVECEIIQWFVEPGARVEEFSKLCEVQSDKASVEITSRFAGIVKKLHYDAGEMARVGKPFVDIDIQGAPSQEALEKLTPPLPGGRAEAAPSDPRQQPQAVPVPPIAPAPGAGGALEAAAAAPKPKATHAAFATPAVRHLCKELKLDILEVDGTGRDGRVLKEDIYRLIEARKDGPAPVSGPDAPKAPGSSEGQVETRQPLTKTQEGMFRAMTRSLHIPHFVYGDEIELTKLAALRTRLNKALSSSAAAASWVAASPDAGAVSKLSYLPFILKAVSIALQQYPVLNARVDLSAAGAAGAGAPALVYRAQHNIGVAMDTPAGLLVPVVTDAGARSIPAIAAELARLRARAAADRLGARDLAGGTVSVSNIGSLGGTYCSPVVVEGQVAILAVGRVRDVPAVEQDGAGGWRVRGMRQVCNFSWAADHRVVDGATMARAAGVVRALVEEPDVMIMHMQ